MAEKKIPRCKFCDDFVSWDEDLRSEAGCNGPVNYEDHKEHKCDPERKKAHQANKAAEELARKQASEMGANGNTNGNNNNNDLSTQLREIAILLKGNLDESRRTNDLLSDISMQTGNIDFNTKKTANSHEWFEKLLETRYRNDELPPRTEITKEEIVGGVQEQ